MAEQKKDTNRKSGAGQRSASGQRGTGSRGRNGTSGNSRRNKNSKEDAKTTNILLVMLLFAVLVVMIVYFNTRKPKEEDAGNVISPTTGAAKDGEDSSLPQGDDAKDKPQKPEEDNSSPDGSENGKEENDDVNKENDAKEDKAEEPKEDSKGNQEGGDSENPTDAAKPSDEEPRKDPEDATEPTKGALPNPTPENEPAATKPFADPFEELLSIEEAEDILSAEIQEKGYSFVLSDDHLNLDGAIYYSYVILYYDQEAGYVVLVDRQNGDLYHYDSNGVKTEFQGVKHYKVDVPAMTVEKAKRLLSGLSREDLMLPAPLSECSLSIDEWKSMVGGEECYCLNVFYNDALAGSIYFSENGEKVYCLDEFGGFVKVK